MMHDSDTKDLELYLAAHAPAKPKRLLEDGAVVDGWRVTALLGKGGNGEVYRVKRVAEDNLTDKAWTPTAPFAALKILVRDSDTARDRFAREVGLLSQNSHSAFPRYFGSGDIRPSSCESHHPYYVMELLEPVELPQGDHAVAAYLLAVVRAVEALHCAGLVHRDIKPQNVMRRENGEIVLIDLGLVRPVSGRSGTSGLTVTVEKGHAVGAGTPRYAAPEQFNGGAVSPATDIHALGMLANECFGGRPPRAWERIISRSTSSIPERRYADVKAFANAVRRRHFGQLLAWIVSTVAIIGAVAIVLSNGRAVTTSPQSEPSFRGGAERAPVSQVMASPTRTKEVITNVVDRQRPLEKTSTSGFATTEAGTIMRLNNREIKYEEPIILDTNRYYWVVGPGTLDAVIEGLPGSRLCLDDCVLINRTEKSLKECGVHYIFRKGSYLNFINQDRNTGFLSYIEDFDAAYNSLEFRGPRTKQELMKGRASYFTHATAKRSKETDNGSEEKASDPAAAGKASVPKKAAGHINSAADSDF